MTSWSIFEFYNRYIRKILSIFLYIKDTYLSRSICVNNNDLLRHFLFMIIIHVSVNLGLLSTIIISYVWCDSSIFIFDICFVIFHNGAWIVLGKNTNNENSIPLPRCHRATPSHEHTMIVARSLWITSVNKRSGGTVSRLCWSDFPLCDIRFPISYTSGQIIILCNHTFAYIIIF